ncbi:aldo/keto reductase [Hysterangium stoloniferum]|nr:aldo/keto reductase [Hysterangium stoloniferum]
MVKTTSLGGTASGIQVAVIGHGLMMMTWTPNPISDEQAFESIIKGVEAAGGAKVLLNSAEFYGHNFGPANLELLARFYKKHPEYVDKTVLCVKGAVTSEGCRSSLEVLRASIDNINAKLEGTKRVDIFESARVDPTRPIEEAIKNMKILIDEGKFGHIGLSECSAETLRRANAVHPIASVEIEVSPWSYEDETRKVIATSTELKVAVLAYSPLGKGFLTGQINKPEDISPGDMRLHFDRFKPENFEHNLKLVVALKSIAEKRGVTPAQLCLAWVRSLSPQIIPIPGSSKATRTLENMAACDLSLTKQELAEIDEILSKVAVQGARYTADTENLWG